jgi:hypothetical protein
MSWHDFIAVALKILAGWFLLSVFIGLLIAQFIEAGKGSRRTYPAPDGKTVEA